MYWSELIEKFEQQTALIGIIGLGNTNLPLTRLFAQAKFKVFGYDVRQALVEELRGGVSYNASITSLDLIKLLESGLFHPTANFEELRDADVYIICLPTTLNKERKLDLSYIENAVEALLEIWEPGKLIIVESIPYPGAIDELFLQPFSKRGLIPDKDFLLALSPERVEEIDKKYELSQIPKILGGITPLSSKIATTLYNMVFDQIIPVSSVLAVELTELLETSYRLVNTALINEFDELCQRLGVSTTEIITAAKSNPSGFRAFSPGSGRVRDYPPMEFHNKNNLSNYEPRLVGLANEINRDRSRQLVYRIMEKLNQLGKPLIWAKVLVLGIGEQLEKFGMWDSPSVTLIEELMLKGAVVTYSDPNVRQITLQDGRELQHNHLSRLLLKDTDLVVITIPYSMFNYQLLTEFEDKVLDVSGVNDTKPEVIKLLREKETTLVYQPLSVSSTANAKRNAS
ncbi:MAG: nucleotide sugar dehydrogenase [Chloroflexi bacterium]|uniref:Nucleotide sugar dehydrogenase n=1 Tax=Candidatus Chlorohelix allophototropha TaxID=3003348 RepID=A0A8T7M9P3_9CHLR|nr:nucleotide sugar dehydrogenase [Chloroflexota bacterium]NWJ48789.1 nucleotide sugar dehydrogenase [Chloroflexota bacterium]WJW68720.1 nucleotide sugar dehydrogenase [Chloroflexota bacterium L227-S17]